MGVLIIERLISLHNAYFNFHDIKFKVLLAQIVAILFMPFGFLAYNDI